MALRIWLSAAVAQFFYFVTCRSQAWGQGPPHRGLGSIDLTAAVRSELLAGVLPGNPKERALIQTKANCGPLSPAIKYTIDGEGFRWLGECSIQAESLLEVPRAGGGKLLEVGVWLRDLLTGGPRSADEVKADAEAKGFSLATVRRAREALGVIPEKEHGRRDSGIGDYLTSRWGRCAT